MYIYMYIIYIYIDIYAYICIYANPIRDVNYRASFTKDVIYIQVRKT